MEDNELTPFSPNLPEYLKTVRVSLDPIPQSIIDAFQDASSQNKEKFPERGKLNFYLTNSDISRLKAVAHIGQAIRALKNIETDLPGATNFENTMLSAGHLFEALTTLQNTDTLRMDDRELEKIIRESIELAIKSSQGEADSFVKADLIAKNLSTKFEWQIQRTYDQGSNSLKLARVLVLDYYQAANEPRWYRFPPDDNTFARTGLSTDPQARQCLEELRDESVISNPTTLRSRISAALV